MQDRIAMRSTSVVAEALPTPNAAALLFDLKLRHETQPDDVTVAEVIQN